MLILTQNCKMKFSKKQQIILEPEQMFQRKVNVSILQFIRKKDLRVEGNILLD